MQPQSKWFTVTTALPIEDFDPDQYGNTWHNVKFAEFADTVMWLAKTKPEESKKVYGHLEKTTSGKRWRFKKDQVPDDGGQAAVPTHSVSGKEGHTSPATNKSVKEMYVAYAKDVYVTMYEKDGKVEEKAYQSALTEIAVGAELLMGASAEKVLDLSQGEEINEDDIPTFDD